MPIMSEMTIRTAVDDDSSTIAAIWEAGWRDAHLGNVPDALARVRTTATFVTRARASIPATLVATSDGVVVGFVMVDHDELAQIYVDARHRGSGVAAALLDAAEHVIAASGYPSAWLAVIAPNERARRFYQRNGWLDDGEFVYRAATQDGAVDVPSRRYTKQVWTDS